MTPTETMTTGEQVENTLVGLAALIGAHNLPAPRHLSISTAGTCSVNVLLDNRQALTRWANAADAIVVSAGEDHYRAHSMLGDVTVWMSAYDKGVQP